MTINEKFAQKLNPPAAIPEASMLPAVIERAVEVLETETNTRQEPMAFEFGYGGYGGNGVYSNTGPVPIMAGVFNGQKSEGSMGLPMDLRVDARALRFRAYEANTTNDIITIVTGKFFKWVIGNGLKMRPKPNKKILEFEKINLDPRAFAANVEEYFEQYAASERSDYAGMDNLHANASKAFETAFLGGDCLVILRVDENNNVTSQVIDGQHVNNPVSSTTQQLAASGNVLINGIEVDPTGKHVAFWVRKQPLTNGGASNPLLAYEYERIEAYGAESGCLMAWMVYGKKNRIDHHRGISMLSAILEKITKLDRYTEATVATAEERAKLVWTVVHGKSSIGDNPLMDGLRAKLTGFSPDSPFIQGQMAANQIALSEERKVYNLPVDSELKTVSSQQEIDYGVFWTAVFDQLCAAMEIPPEVALQKYNSNYSASRAAIMGWEYIVKVYRKRFSEKYYQPFYDLWLYVHVLKGKVEAPGYIESKHAGNKEVVEAYSAAQFTGVNMPNIDPLKEANSIRVMLGINDQTPLITHEEAAERLGAGDFDANLDKIADEMELIKEAGLPDILPLPPVDPANKGTNI